MVSDEAMGLGSKHGSCSVGRKGKIKGAHPAIFYVSSLVGKKAHKPFLDGMV